MFVPQLRQRTTFPRADEGTASTLRHVSLGHMIRTLSFDIDDSPRLLAGIDATGIPIDPARQPACDAAVRRPITRTILGLTMSAPHAHPAPSGSKSTVVVGLQWGDEGKGKIVHLLTPRFDAVARYNGGANAGHSVVVKGERFALHLIPSGILHAGKPSVIGNGVVVDPAWLIKEMDTLSARGVDLSGLKISDRAHVVMPWHKDEDERREKWLSAGSSDPIGTTKRGIGPCYADKAQRGTAIRMGDLLRPEVLAPRLDQIAPLKTAILGAMTAPGSPAPRYDAGEMLALVRSWGERLGHHITDTSALLLNLLDQGKRVLFEGANATLLDVDHGTYPFVTSSGTSALGAPAGAGVPMSAVSDILGIMKAYSTRVGGGAMPTELVGDPAKEALAHQIRERGREYGTTTGRPRRVGWLDLVAVRYSARLNGTTGLSVMLLDVLAGIPELKVCTGYRHRLYNREVPGFIPDGLILNDMVPQYVTLPGFSGDVSAARRLADLPAEARTYLDLIERTVGTPVRYVSVGPDRDQTIEV